MFIFQFDKLAALLLGYPTVYATSKSDVGKKIYRYTYP